MEGPLFFVNIRFSVRPFFKLAFNDIIKILLMTRLLAKLKGILLVIFSLSPMVWRWMPGGRPWRQRTGTPPSASTPGSSGLSTSGRCTTWYLDVNIHPDTCSAIRPLYSVPLSLLSPEPQLDNAESRSLDPYDFLAQQLSWPLYPLGHAMMRQEFSEQYPTALGSHTQLATEQRIPFQIRAH